MLSSFKRATQKPLANNASAVRLEREGRERIKRMSQAVTDVAWKSTLLNMLWIGGPVTFIGAIGGYYVGYGRLPTLDNLVFFVFFAVVTSAAGILGNIFNNYHNAGHSRQIARQISRVIDDVPELIMMARDLGVDQLEGDARRREAATILLRKQDLHPSGIELAVRELLNDDKSARIFGDIETYRRTGVRSRISDLVIDHGDHVNPLLNELRTLAPEAAALLSERFYGRTRDLNKGIPRDENFIERVLSAIEQDDDLLMTLDDVGQMLTLAFELINGRQIPMLVFEYLGRWRLAQALDGVEQARARYRISQALGLSRLKALTVYLAETAASQVEDAAPGLRSEVLLERSRNAMDELATQITRLARRPDVDQAELSSKADVLTNAVRLYRRMRDSFDQVNRHHESLERAVQRWERIANEGPDSMTRLRLDKGRQGLRIRESSIALDYRARARVCERLTPHLRALHGYAEQTALLPHETPKQRLSLTTESAKRLAIEVALALEPHIHLSRPEVQRAIHSTNAADFSALETGYSAATKAALADAMVKEVEEDLSRSAESLALALVRHYQVELEPAAIDFLCQQYGARRGTLEMLSNYEHNPERRINLSRQRMPPLGRTPRRWYQALVVARQVSEQH